MYLTPEQKRIKGERNQLIIQDYINGMTRMALKAKYNLWTDQVIKDSGIKLNKKSGRPRKYIPEETPDINTDDKDRKWIDKQIIALTKQGYSNAEIMKRYEVNHNRIARVKREAGILTGKLIHSANAKNVSEVPSMGDLYIPYADNCNVRPKRYSEHYSQVIYG